MHESILKDPMTGSFDIYYVKTFIKVDKDNGGWAVPYKTKSGEKKITAIKFKSYEPYKPSDTIAEYKFYGWKSSIWRRLKAGVCELCKVPMEDSTKGVVHVVKKLKYLGKNLGKRL